MSMCAVNMQKYNAGAIGGIQSHNQREHESRKNREIDPERAHLNYDTVNDERINYQAKIKERIKDLNLKRAVRKDAVVLCSFIVSSDKEFFHELGRHEHDRRENQNEMTALGFRDPLDFDMCDKEYQAECIAKGSEPFFRDATQFFQRHFGKENVVNGNVHHDELGAAHMHLGLVPVTKEGRLSAKTLFTPDTLRQLQTDFANEVGAKYDLERGREGSTAKHLDELTFKLEQRKGKLDDTNEELNTAQRTLASTRQQLQTASQERHDIQMDVAALSGEKEKLEADLGELRADGAKLLADLRGQVSEAKSELKILDKAIKEKNEEGERTYGMATWQQKIKEERAAALQSKEESLLAKFAQYLIDKFPQIKALWQQFLNENESRKKKKMLSNDNEERR